MRRNPLRALCLLAAGSSCALAAESTPTSSVSLYGFLDIGVLDSNEGSTQVGTIQRSYLGMRGQES